MYRSSPVELRFLSLAQALENLHHKITQKRVRLKKRLDEITDWIPIPLRKRLIVDIETFTNEVRDNRNYFTHYDENNPNHGKRLHKLFELSEKMKLVLMVIVLKQLSLTDRQVSDFILKNGIFQFNHLLAPEDDAGRD